MVYIKKKDGATLEWYCYFTRGITLIVADVSFACVTGKRKDENPVCMYFVCESEADIYKIKKLDLSRLLISKYFNIV